MEGTSVVRRQRRATERTRRWRNTPEDGIVSGGAPGGAPRRAAPSRRTRARISVRARGRRRGNGRSDAVRLPARGNLRRVERRRGAGSRPTPGRKIGWTTGPGETRRTPGPEPRCKCAGPEVGGSRRGGGRPRGRNGTPWRGSHGPRGRSFGAVPGVDDRGERRRRGGGGRIPGEDGGAVLRGTGPKAPDRERWIRSEGEEAARRTLTRTSRARQSGTTKPPPATVNGRVGTRGGHTSGELSGRVGDHRDLERQRTERARTSSDGPG